MVQIVNGYACHNSADVALARRGIEPAPPKPKSTEPTPARPAPSSVAAPSTADPARLGRGRFVDLIA
jgi:hypothetical protein